MNMQNSVQKFCKKVQDATGEKTPSSFVAINPFNIPDRIYFLIVKLCLSMGLCHPQGSVLHCLEYLSKNPQMLHSRKHTFDPLLLNEYRLPFKELESTEEGRGNAFMLMYRRLLDVEPLESRRYQYMRLCFKLFDMGGTEMLHREDILNARLVLFDRLNEHNENLIKTAQVRNQLDHVDVEEKAKDTFKNGKRKMYEQTKLLLKPRINIVKFVEYAWLETTMPMVMCQPKGMQRLQELALTKKQETEVKILFQARRNCSLKQQHEQVNKNMLVEKCQNQTELQQQRKTYPRKENKTVEMQILWRRKGPEHSYSCQGLAKDSSRQITFLEDLVVHKPKQENRKTMANESRELESSQSDYIYRDFEVALNQAAKTKDLVNTFSLDYNPLRINKPDNCEIFAANAFFETIAACTQRFVTSLYVDQRADIKAQAEEGIRRLRKSCCLLRSKTQLVGEIVQMSQQQSVESVTDPRSTTFNQHKSEEIVRETVIEPTVRKVDESNHKAETVVLRTLPRKQQTYQKRLPKAQPIGRYEQHIIVATRSIIKLFQHESFKEAYEVTQNCHEDPNFFEQWNEFNAFVATSNFNENQSSLDLKAIKLRLKQMLHEVTAQMPADWSYRIWHAQVAKLQLGHLLNPQEWAAYDRLRMHAFKQMTRKLLPGERLSDALSVMLGSECKQLAYCRRNAHFELRMRQGNISDDYLLLALGNLGYYCRMLQQQQLAICGLWHNGESLAECLHEQLLQFKDFCKQQHPRPGSLLRLLLRSRQYELKFKWLLQLTQRCLNSQKPLLLNLQQHLGHGHSEYNKLLQKWLLLACEAEVKRICNWLHHGHVEHDCALFFIQSHEETSNEMFWQSAYSLNMQRLPPFLDVALAQQLLAVGKSCQYFAKFLGISCKGLAPPQQLQRQLNAAVQQHYEQHNGQPLQLLIAEWTACSSGELLQHLGQMRKPLEDFAKLRQFVLLGDVQFVNALMEQLEPALEQPASLYDARQLNYMLQQMMSRDMDLLYVDTLESCGHTCWSRFLLQCRLSAPWSILLGHSLQRYAALFAVLWTIRHATYVLHERIRRQQKHFKFRMDSEPVTLYDVELRMQSLLKQLVPLMDTLHHHIYDEVIANAFGHLQCACQTAKHMDELLAAHAQYLDDVELGVFQSQTECKCWTHLKYLLELVLELDEEQQKFIRLSQLLLDFMIERDRVSKFMERQQEFCWSCRNMWDVLKDLEERLTLGMIEFLCALHCTRQEQFQVLARRLDADEYYYQRSKRLRKLQTFEFVRKCQQ